MQHSQHHQPFLPSLALCSVPLALEAPLPPFLFPALSLCLGCLLWTCPLSTQFNYYNSVLINEKDEKGDYVELGDEFLLEPDAHFSNQRVNVSLSSVQLPTNVYNKGGHVLTVG